MPNSLSTISLYADSIMFADRHMACEQNPEARSRGQSNWTSSSHLHGRRTTAPSASSVLQSTRGVENNTEPDLVCHLCSLWNVCWEGNRRYFLAKLQSPCSYDTCNDFLCTIVSEFTPFRFLFARFCDSRKRFVDYCVGFLGMPHFVACEMTLKNGHPLVLSPPPLDSPPLRSPGRGTAAVSEYGISKAMNLLHSQPARDESQPIAGANAMVQSA